MTRAIWTTAAIATLTATAAATALMIVAGARPLDVWAAVGAATLGDAQGLGQVIFRATPLILTGLAVAVPLRAGLFNIGGEGQLTAAAMAAAAVAAAIPPGTPAVVAVPVACAAAMAVGAALGAGVGALRTYRGAHEVIVAILINTIVSGVVLWIGNRWLFGAEAPRTATIVDGARLPELGVAGSNASVSALGAVVAAVAIAAVFTRTTTGFGWRAIGLGADAARAAGLAVERAQITAMAVGGAMAGLAGAHFVLGHKHAYEDGLGRGYGFIGIAVALLVGGRPLAVIASALLFAILGQGGMGVTALVPKEMVDVVQAVVVLVAAAAMARRSPR